MPLHIEEIQYLKNTCAHLDDAYTSLKSTFDTSQKENVILQEENKKLKICIELLQYEKEELERSQKLNSSNSSKPPSSDGFKKQKRTKSLKEPTTEKPGRKKGCKTTTLRQVSNPDKITNLKKDHYCTCCNLNLDEIPLSKKYTKRQKFDFPEPKIEVTEFRLFKKKCPGCKTTILPPCEINGRVEYGKKISSLSGYLSGEQLIPLKRISLYFKSLYNSSLCGATVNTINKKLSKLCKNQIEKIKEYLEKSKIKHLDETGFRMEGESAWLHSMSNKEATLYTPSKKRGDVPIEARGIVVHDNYCSYNKIKEAVHATCNVHHLRELQALKEIEKESWSKYMFNLLKIGNKRKTQSKEIPISKKYIAKYISLYNKIIKKGLEFHINLKPLPSKFPKRKKRRRGHNLLERLKKNKEKVLLFLKKEEVPFSNNQAERDIRMMKLKQKISGGFRKEEGAKIFCNIKSLISTLSKQKMNTLENLEKLLNGKLDLKLTPI